MDVKSPRYWHAKVAGNAEPFTFHGSIIEALPRLTVWLKQQRSGRITIECDRQPITGESRMPDLISPELFPETPQPAEQDTWESYYRKLLAHFEGSDSMARFIANEHFDQPQLPWVGDDRVARFIHMNASMRQYLRADPSEYATLDAYVSSTYPDLYATLVLQG